MCPVQSLATMRALPGTLPLEDGSMEGAGMTVSAVEQTATFESAQAVFPERLGAVWAKGSRPPASAYGPCLITYGGYTRCRRC